MFQLNSFKLQRLIFVANFAVLLVFPVKLSAQNSARQFLRDRVATMVRQMQPQGRLSDTQRLDLAIGLPLRNESGFDQLLQEIYDPTSPNFRHYLTPQQFAERFGPSESDYAAVIAFAQTNGLTVTGTSSDRTFVSVSGSVANIEKAFHVTMRTYRHPRENRNFYAPDTEPSLDLAVPILHITGLDNFVVPHPADLKKISMSQLANLPPNSGSGPSGTFIGQDFRNAYAPGVSLDGSGQIVGLFELDGYYPGDITAYETSAGLPDVPLTNVLVGGSGSAGKNNGEVALDIEMAISMATNLAQIIVYEGPNPLSNSQVVTILGQMASDNLAKQISSSWTIGDDPNFETKYKQFAAQGQSFFQSSGDDGAYYSGILQSADSTNVTLVGGTTLSTDSDGDWSSETTWNWYITNPPQTNSSGGGVSTTYSIPSWQQGIDMTANQGSTTKRNVPDVALTADNIFVVADNGKHEVVGGTSAAAPLWAGFCALVNQQAVASGQPTVGFINPAIYAIGKSSFYLSDFHDITTGNNTNKIVSSKYFAVSGYDLCTGWGTPNGINLIIDLATPDTLGILPGNGFAASGPIGGPFAPHSENFSLTNTGASSLNWAAITPSWLAASPNNNTLTAHSFATVTISLNSAATGLSLGTYTANVVFTNLTSHVAQLRQFTLQVNPIVQNGGFETGDFTDWTFDGTETSSDGFLLNGVVNARTFADDYGTNFVHSGADGLALGQPGNLAFLSQTLLTAPGQNYLLSFWVNNIGGATPNQFLVNWNTNTAATNTIFNQTNVPEIDNWTNLQFILAA
ncbi:MAG TPA: protease pro-enzyme activation domain-containing protein, partial [Verrucomicrobiae bacterium]|nr:protease pro-enzyme activation domain-containing protein [Verrucomicrobiae bacterium]